MNEELIMRLGQQTIQTAALLAAPILCGTLLIGLIVSVFQTVTQINEATLTFIPKIAAVLIILVLAGPWMLDVLSVFTINLFENISTFVR